MSLAIRLTCLVAPVLLGLSMVAATMPDSPDAGPTQIADAAASRARTSPPYVVAGPGGVFYAKSVAADAALDGTTQGTTTVYRVGSDVDTLVDRYDWYAPRSTHPGLVMQRSPIAGRIAVMRLHAEPIPMAEDRVEISFYLGGAHLKSYTLRDLVALGADDPMSPSRVRVRTGALRDSLQYTILDTEQVPRTNDYRFAIQSAGRTILFDILTGEVVPWSAGPQGDVAVRTSLVYLAQNQIDTSNHDLSQPQWVREIARGERRGHSIGWGLRQDAEGGQMIVFVWDSGDIEFTHGR